MDTTSTVHVGIGFVTGRRSFLKVLKTYIYNWKESGLTDIQRVQIHVFVAYDLQYSNSKAIDFTKVSKKLAANIVSIEFIDAAYIQAQADELVQQHVIDAEEAALFFASGYAAMRNAILYAAAKRRMDYLLYLDDDEYPLAVTKNGTQALWSGQHLLANHLRHIHNADITFGLHCGYISPIPSLQFNAQLTEADFRLFIEAISNDIINWEDLSKVMGRGGVTYAQTEVLQNETVTEIPEINHCKFISGSNLCINLTKTARVFPFYNPPGARGEDTFLSTCLTDRTVLQLPTYAFHNGFSTYDRLLSGVLPTELAPITMETRSAVDRFYRACVGWIRYKPLLLYITRRDRYDELILEMQQKLALVLPKIAVYFHAPRFKKIIDELDQYDRDVTLHYDMFRKTQAIWQKMSAYLQQNADG